MKKAQYLCTSIACRNYSTSLSFLAPSATIHSSTILKRTSTSSVKKPHCRSFSSTRCSLASESSKASVEKPKSRGISLEPKNDPATPDQSKSEAVTGDAQTVVDEQEAEVDAAAAVANRIASGEVRQYIDPSFRANAPQRWGAPLTGVRRPNQISEKQSQINDLVRSMQRPPSTRGSARTSAQLLRERAPMMTPTARRQEELARNPNLMGPLIERQLFGHEHARIDPPLPVRVDAYMGRAQAVDRVALPLGRALAMMNQKVNNNNVRGELRRQKFHERPGLKRKRLKSERWRARFMVGFRHMIDKVKKMKNQGW